VIHPITVNVDAYLLRCAHRRALTEDTSVNALLQRFIAEYATGDVIHRRATLGTAGQPPASTTRKANVMAATELAPAV
jgi:hypothetical protein